MTTPANEEKSTTAKTNASTTKTAVTEGTVKVKLLAHSWQRRVPGTNPIEYQRFQRGAEFEVTEEEFDVLTSPDQFKPTVAKVEE